MDAGKANSLKDTIQSVSFFETASYVKACVDALIASQRHSCGFSDLCVQVCTVVCI